MEVSPHSAGDEAESSHCNLEVQSMAESVCTFNLPPPQIKCLYWGGNDSEIVSISSPFIAERYPSMGYNESKLEQRQTMNKRKSMFIFPVFLLHRLLCCLYLSLSNPHFRGNKKLDLIGSRFWMICLCLYVPYCISLKDMPFHQLRQGEIFIKWWTQPHTSTSFRLLCRMASQELCELVTNPIFYILDI